MVPEALRMERASYVGHTQGAAETGGGERKAEEGRCSLEVWRSAQTDEWKQSFSPHQVEIGPYVRPEKTELPRNKRSFSSYLGISLKVPVLMHSWLQLS